MQQGGFAGIRNFPGEILGRALAKNSRAAEVANNFNSYRGVVPTAKPTNWIEGTRAVLRARKGQDDKVLVATCTSANGKPPSVVSWETRLKGEAEYQEIRNPNGTVTVISRYRLVPSKEAHRQSLACIVNYHLDRFRESLTLNVQCEPGPGALPTQPIATCLPLPSPNLLPLRSLPRCCSPVLSLCRFSLS